MDKEISFEFAAALWDDGFFSGMHRHDGLSKSEIDKFQQKILSICEKHGYIVTHKEE